MHFGAWTNLTAGFFIGISGVALSGINRELEQRRQATLRESLIAVAFFNSTLTEDEARQAAERLAQEDSAILETQFISKKEALQTAQADPTLSRALLVIRDNPLPASVKLRYSEIAWIERGNPAEKLQGHSEITEVRWDAAAQTQFREFSFWTRVLARLNLLLGALLILWALFGLTRFWRARTSFRPLAGGVLMAALGGGVAGLAVYGVLVWGGLRIAPQEALAWIFPGFFTGGVAGIALFGYKTRHEA